MVYDTSIGVVVIHSDGTEDMYTFGASGINRIPGEMVTANRFTETIDTEGDIDLVVGDKVCFRVQSTIGRDRLIIRSIDSFAGTFKMVAVAGKEVPYGAKFPITKNLPNIKIVDFVKFLSCITGTFARQVSDDGVVEFVAFDDIDMQDAEDWTGRIVASSDKNIADGLTFKMSDWAMMNWYRWKEDKATGSYDGMLYVDDDTLEKERDVITFPFAASDGGNAPLFKYEWVQDDDGNWNREETFSKCEPRIYTTGDVTVVSGGVEHHYPKLDFGIDMQRIIDERYMLLSDMLNGCKVIEEKIMIRTSEIAAFDETHPVWLGQYGAYFLVIELRAGNDGTATAKMVKLNIRS